jgi:hypothetical protein
MSLRNVASDSIRVRKITAVCVFLASVRGGGDVVRECTRSPAFVHLEAASTTYSRGMR